MRVQWVTRLNLIFALLSAVALVDPALGQITDRNQPQPEPTFFPQTEEPDKKTDICFPADIGNYESQCWYRDQLNQSNGYLTINVPIDRHVGDVTKLLQNQLIGKYAIVKINMFDAGEVGSFDSIYVNNFAYSGRALGANCAWVTYTFPMPVDSLRFPARGQNGNAPTPVNNVIKIAVDAQGSQPNWCISLDWASISIQVVRPTLFVHGGFSSHLTWTRDQVWDDGLFLQYGVPYLNNLDMTPSPQFVDWMSKNANKIDNKVAQLKTETGSKRVNLVCHSKGGLDARWYVMKSNADLDVDRIAQFGTPNAGTPLADQARSLLIRPADTVLPPINTWEMSPGGMQLTTEHMKRYNNGPLRFDDPRVRYTAIAGDYDPNCLFCPEAFRGLILNGANDTFVPQWSVHDRNYNDEDTMSGSKNGGGDQPNAIHTGNNVGLTKSIRLRDEYMYPRFQDFRQRSITVEAPVVESPVAFRGTVHEGNVEIGAIDFDDSVSTLVELAYPSGNLDLVLQAPSGQTYRQSSVAGNPAFSWTDQELLDLRAEAVTFTPPELGQWTVKVEGDSIVEQGNDCDFAVRAYFHNPRTTLETLLPRAELSLGDTVLAVGILKRDGTPLLNKTVAASIIRPNGTIAAITLSDSGVAPDTTANDGRYTGRYITATSGAHEVVTFGSGTVGGTAFSRVGYGVATVATSRTTLGSITGNQGIHLDGNGKFDRLKISAQLAVTANATYAVAGVLRDALGYEHVAHAETTLTAGTRTVFLMFNGEAIGNRRVNGPYTLTDLRISEVTTDDMLNVGQWQPSYATASYDFRDFEHVPFALSGVSGSQSLDAGGFPGDEECRVYIGVDVDAAMQCRWWGRLVDSEGRELSGLVEGSGLLGAGSDSLELSFSGTCIRHNNVNGPYYVKDLLVAGPSFAYFAGDSIPTSHHAASEFTMAYAGASSVVEDNTLTTCPAGDADVLRFKTIIPNPCGYTDWGNPPNVYATKQYPTHMMVWDSVSPTDAEGDTLRPYKFTQGAAADTAWFEASRISGCIYPTWNTSGQLSYKSRWDGQLLSGTVNVDIKSLDLDRNRKAFGAIDRWDLERFHEQRGAIPAAGHCSNFDWDDSTDASDLTTIMTHYNGRHHAPRQLFTPNGGQDYGYGQVVPIKWLEGKGDSSFVQLRLIREGASDTTIVTYDRPDSGQFNWTIPATAPPGTHRMEVVHTAGKYNVDYRDIGKDRSDTTFVIRPNRVTDLGGDTGKTTAVLWWTEPGQGGGSADQYEIRYLEGGTISDANWSSPGTVAVPSPPGPGGEGTWHCKPVSGLTACRNYTFGIRTLDNGVWSTVSNIASLTTYCSGSEVMCDMGGLMGGGGGGEEGAVSTQDLISEEGESRPAGEASYSENSLRLGSVGTDAIDLLQLPALGGDSYTVRLRQIGDVQANIDGISLGVVDHLPDLAAHSGPDSVYLGTPVEVAAILDSLGSPLDSLRIPGLDYALAGREGTVLTVHLVPSTGRAALLVESSRPRARTVGELGGILVQRMGEGRNEGWVTLAELQPRREFGLDAIPDAGAQTLRLVFRGTYSVRRVRQLTNVEATVPRLVEMTNGAHSRLGDVAAAVRLSGGTRTEVTPSDTLTLTFTRDEIPSGKVRDFFLLSRGSYEDVQESEVRESGQTALRPAPTWSFALGHARPNPTTGETTIGYTLARETAMSLRIYNVAGRLVRTLEQGVFPAGPHEAVWDGRDSGGRRVGAGMYFYRLVAESWSSRRKLVMLQR